MKKRLGLVVCAAAALGAVAVPAGNAFGSAAKQAARCAALEAKDTALDNTTPTDPVSIALVNSLEAKADAQIAGHGCSFTD
jgi:hypothetical protein